MLGKMSLPAQPLVLGSRSHFGLLIVTPLNLLGKQNVDSLCHAGLRAIAVSSENANATCTRSVLSTFSRMENLPSGNWQNIEDENYNVVIIKLLMSNEVTMLLTKPKVNGSHHDG